MREKFQFYFTPLTLAALLLLRRRRRPLLPRHPPRHRHRLPTAFSWGPPSFSLADLPTARAPSASAQATCRPSRTVSCTPAQSSPPNPAPPSPASCLPRPTFPFATIYPCPDTLQR